MTVCIAALASSSEGHPDSVILASDRMVTLGNFIEFEHQVPKVAVVAPRVCVLMAGDALRGSQIVRHLRGMFSNAQPSVGQVAQAASQAYHELRLAAIDQDIMLPRGLSLQAFNQGQQLQLQPQFGFNLNQDIATYDFGVELIVAGVDEGGGHIFTVNNPGTRANDHEQIGFVSIGSGAIHAMQSFIAARHTKQRSLEQAVFNVYAAKRRAEVAPGVGNETDMLVISPQGGQQLPEAYLDQLQEIYVRATQPAYDKIVEEVKGLGLMKDPPAPDNPQSGAENPAREAGDPTTGENSSTMQQEPGNEDGALP